MGYTEEKKTIIDYITHDGKIIELERDNSNLKAYCKILVNYMNNKKIIIRFPGYKTNKQHSDYCVCLDDGYEEHPISHIEIMNDLYNKTNYNNYDLMKKYIEDVAVNGREIEFETYQDIDFNIGFNFNELTDLMFYIAIQEDINYPDTRYQGRKMCFYRYLEAIYCKISYSHKLDEVIERATAKKYIPPKWQDVGDLYSIVSNIQR